MSERVVLADRFAEGKHAGQKDKAGLPYVEHPRAVAARVESEEEKIVALLHDTVEDTNATIDEIRELFGPENNGRFHLSDWMFSKLLKDGSYYYTLRVNTEEDIAEYWHQLTAVTVVMREVQPISYLIR